MSLKRRDFIRLSAGKASLGSALLYGMPAFLSADGAYLSSASASSLNDLKPMTGDVAPITLQERLSRVEKAQRLMVENKIEALLLDSGTSLVYFTGISWWPSERTMVAVIPAKGEVKYISPAFEAERLRELIKIGTEVRTWEEHESPYKVIAGVFKDFGIKSGNIGIEERVRFFIMDGVRKEASHLNYVSGDPVTMPCRLIKSPAEIALLKKANDITIAAYKATVALLHEGMTPADFQAIATDAHARLGVNGEIGANFGQASAYPHGSIQPQHLKKGDVIIMDGGGKVEGYTSDISRTIVFGAAPTDRQRQIWDLEKKAQSAGFAAARIGAPCENVDIAARKVLTDAGFGPGYKIPGLPHRTGHGIGMDMHEWGNMVLGNKLPLQAGMCFSVEPMIAIYGEFGMRLEDCAYMTEEGPQWFSQPSPAIDQPFAP
ncbi:MAG TPA: Xaa-Pro peptidase family protein [Puia sp.]|jgi:Xaa-Pro dipeptidase|nr:Xaa-Pro peptidase family protein [Puia sp.]